MSEIEAGLGLPWRIDPDSLLWVLTRYGRPVMIVCEHTLALNHEELAYVVKAVNAYSSNQARIEELEAQLVCEDCGGDGAFNCTACSGSGEGKIPGSTCRTCGGDGEVPCHCQEEK